MPQAVPANRPPRLYRQLVQSDHSVKAATRLYAAAYAIEEIDLNSSWFNAPWQEKQKWERAVRQAIRENDTISRAVAKVNACTALRNYLKDRALVSSVVDSAWDHANEQYRSFLADGPVQEVVTDAEHAAYEHGVSQDEYDREEPTGQGRY